MKICTYLAKYSSGGKMFPAEVLEKNEAQMLNTDTFTVNIVVFEII
jgi:hypothetical protein